MLGAGFAGALYRVRQTCMAARAVVTEEMILEQSIAVSACSAPLPTRAPMSLPLISTSTQHSPDKSPKRRRGLRTPAHAAETQAQCRQEHRQRDEARKPEQRGERIGGEGRVLVRQLGEVHRRDGQVGDREERPQRGEDEEVDLRGRADAVADDVPVRDWEMGGQLVGWEDLKGGGG